MTNNKRLLCSWQEFALPTRQQINESREQNNGNIVLKGILQKADTLNQNGRIYPKWILEREVENYQKYIIERRACGHCVPPGTEIFTQDGWKNIEDINENEIIYTLNVDLNTIELQQIDKKVILPFSGNLLRFYNNHTYDMCLTPDHKVLFWNRRNEPETISAQDLKIAFENNNSHISHSTLRRAGAIWNGTNPEEITIGDVKINPEVWAAFLGIYLAEGFSSGTKKQNSKKYNVVSISQNVGETCEKIKTLMKCLPWKVWENKSPKSKRFVWIIRDKALHDYLYKLGNSREKYIPNDVKMWNTKLLQILLDWMILGDGLHRCNNTVIEYATTSKKLANDVAEIMFKIGNGASIRVWDRTSKDHTSPDKDRIIRKENCVDMNIVYQHKSKTMRLINGSMRLEEIPYEGNVYCVTVPNATWLMRYNGKVCWTHNCDHPEHSVVELKEISHNIIQTWWEGNVLYGKLEILNTPNGKILQSLIEDRIKLGVSSRGVGSTEKDGDYHVVQDDFQLICWDMVSEPSTPGAFMLPEHAAYLPEGKELKRLDPFYEAKTTPTQHCSYNDTIDTILSMKRKA